MPPSRKKKGASASAGAYPSGPVLLGKLIDALAISIAVPKEFLEVGEAEEDARSRSSYRALAGDIVEEDVVLEVCDATASALVRKDVIPSSAEGAALIAVALHALVRQWDFATIEHRIGASIDLDHRAMTLAAAQLFAVELGIRAGAWISLSGHHASVSEERPSASETMDVVLRSIAGPLAEVAAKLKLDETTLYRWRHGKARPSDANLDAIAGHLTQESQLSIGAVRRRLAIAAILDELGNDLLPFDVEDVWRMFVRTTNRTVAFLDTRPLDVAANNLRRNIVLLGTGSDGAVPLIERLREQELEFRWLAVIDSLRNWNQRLEYVRGVAFRFSAARCDPMLAGEARILLVNIALAESSEAIEQVVSIWSDKRPELASVFRCWGELLHAAIAKRRGDRLGLVRHLSAAKELSNESAVQEAVLIGLVEAAELETAVNHAANTSSESSISDARMIWAVKQIAEGDVHHGREELERMFGEGNQSGELLMYLGTARWRCDDFASALEALEQVLALPAFEHHALVCDIAAECAFRQGNQKRGAELARRANRLGVWRTYMMWQWSKLTTPG